MQFHLRCCPAREGFCFVKALRGSLLRTHGHAGAADHGLRAALVCLLIVCSCGLQFALLRRACLTASGTWSELLASPPPHPPNEEENIFFSRTFFPPLRWVCR